MIGEYRFVRLIIFISFLYSSPALAIIYGSETEVALFPAVTFPAADHDNAMVGFGWFKNGITLEDATTACVFDSVYPVAGSLTLHGGTVHLYQDLILSNTATLFGGATFVGNHHALQLCSSITDLSATYTFQNTVVIMGSDITVHGQLVFDGDCYIQGQLFHLNVDEGSILVTPGSRLVFDNLDLDGVAGKNIACMDDSACIVLHDSEVRFTNDFLFDTGRIEFSEKVDFMGSHTFWYDSYQTSTINSGACWTVTEDMTLKIGRKKAVDYTEPFYFVDESSTIKLDNCSLLITSSGLGLSRGKFELDRDVSVNVLSSSTMNGLVLGTGQEGGDFSMKLNSGAAISLLAGWWVYNNMQSSGRLHALSSSSRCTRYADSKFCVLKDWTIPPMIFQVASGMPVSLLGDGVKFRYDNTKLILPSGEMEVTGSDCAPGFFLNGNDILYMSKGIQPLPIYVHGHNNKLHGTGSIVAPITLQDCETDLCCQVQGIIDEDIYMNGGTLMLMGDLELGLDAVLSGSGTVDLSGQSFNFSIKRGIWDSSLRWMGSGILNLKADTNLIGTWTIQGDCIIDGNDNVLDLTGGGQLIIEKGSSLVLQDIMVKGITASSVRCNDDSSELVLKGVIWDQSADYTFDTGSITFGDENIIQGAYKFIYDSRQTSTINSHSSVAISEDMTLQIGRKEAIGYVEPLYFVDGTSILQLNNCSYIITATGMRLTNGRLDISGDVTVDILGTNSGSGLELGDGIDGHDMLYRFDASGSLKFRQGWLIYNCYSPYGFVASSENASVTRYGATGLYLKRPWVYPRMGLNVTHGNPMTIAEGGSLSYDNTHLTLSTVECDIVGQLIGSVQFRLNGNNSLCLTKGAFPAYLYVAGQENLIYGNGDITGPIIFQDSSAQLACSLLGTVFLSPFLNGGTLTLKGDLQFGPNVTVMTGGVINLSYYRIILNSTACAWTKDIAWSGTGGAVTLRADLDLLSTWSFSGECTIDGRGSVLNLGQDGKIAVQDNAILTIKNTVIKGVAGDNIQCATDNARLILDNVTYEEGADTIFSHGAIKILNKVDFKGSYSFVYDSICTSTISAGSIWSIGDGIIFTMGRKHGNEPLKFESKTNSILSFQDCSFIVTDSGMNLLGGKVAADGDVTIDASLTSSSQGLIFGNGDLAQDTGLLLNAGSTVRFKSGWLVYNNVAPDKILETSKSARVIRYGDSKVYIQQDWMYPEMALSVESGQPITILADGKMLRYHNAHLNFDGTEFDFLGNQFGDAYFALEGDGLMFLSKGAFECYLWVSGTGNRLRGTGDITGPIQFADAYTELISDFNGSMMYDPGLSGGTLTLANDFYLGGHTTFAQTGTINLAAHQCFLGTEDQVWTSTLLWKNGSISLNSHVVLHGQWMFDGDCVVQGSGNMLDLDGTGELLVAEGATLSLRNMRIRGISAEQIRCLGPKSNVILDDIIWEQDGDVVFSQGHLTWAHEVIMKGNSTFSYQSGQVSTIFSESNLILDRGFTWIYDPQQNASKDLLKFEDVTASLILDSATFHVTTTGINLQNGTLQVKGESYLLADKEVEEDTVLVDEGICLGDGDSLNDMACEILSGASLHVQSGAFIYNNSKPDLLTMLRGSSRLYFHAGTRLTVMETLNCGAGALYLSNQAKIDIKPGKELLGSIFTTE